MAITTRFGWGEVEVPVTETPHGVGDQRGDRRQIDRVNRVPDSHEPVGGGGDVQRGGIDHTVGDQLVKLNEFILIDRVIVGENSILDTEGEPVGEAVEGLDPVGDRGDGLP